MYREDYCYRMNNPRFFKSSDLLIFVSRSEIKNVFKDICIALYRGLQRILLAIYNLEWMNNPQRDYYKQNRT